MQSISHWTIRKSPFLLFLSPLPFTPFLFPLFSVWRRKWQPTPGFLPGESHGRRSLMGYRPWGREELDMTEQLALCSVSSTTDRCTLTVYKEHYCAWSHSPSLDSLLRRRNILPSLSSSSFLALLPSFSLLCSSSCHYFLRFPRLLLWSEGRHSALGL